MPDCQYRGEEARRVDCPSCKGNVQVKIFSCAVHGECSISKQIPGIHVCDGIRPAKAMPSAPPILDRASGPTYAGTVLKRFKATDQIADVRLDDGRIVTAANRGRKGHPGKRCVVSQQAGEWVLWQ